MIVPHRYAPETAGAPGGDERHLQRRARLLPPRRGRARGAALVARPLPGVVLLPCRGRKARRPGLPQRLAGALPARPRPPARRRRARALERRSLRLSASATDRRWSTTSRSSSTTFHWLQALPRHPSPPLAQRRRSRPASKPGRSHFAGKSHYEPSVEAQPADLGSLPGGAWLRIRARAVGRDRVRDSAAGVRMAVRDVSVLRAPPGACGSPASCQSGL